jgi:hypothetical protein
MPTKEEQNTAETETVQQSQPETGAAETTADIQENNENVKPEENPGDNELAKWKAMSRKNEKQAEANLKQVQQVQAELAQVRADNARLIAKSTYPQVTDKVFEALYKGDGTPEDIADFAKSYAELNPIQPVRRWAFSRTAAFRCRKPRLFAAWAERPRTPKASSIRNQSAATPTSVRWTVRTPAAATITSKPNERSHTHGASY